MLRLSITRLVPVVACLTIFGCGRGPTEPACRGEPNIGVEGGTLSLGTEAVLAIPAGAFSAACGLSVRLAPWSGVISFFAPYLTTSGISGTAFEVRAADLSPEPKRVSLAKPATLAIRYDPTQLPPLVSESELIIAQVTRVGCTPSVIGGCPWDLAFRPVWTSVVDGEAHVVSATLSCLDVCGGREDGTGAGTGEFVITTHALIVAALPSSITTSTKRADGSRQTPGTNNPADDAESGIGVRRIRSRSVAKTY
jgi:hypothetical protein